MDARCDGQGGHHPNIAGIIQNSEGDAKKGGGESAIVDRLNDDDHDGDGGA